MNNENDNINRHLTQDEILMALVDETDLGPDLQTHLSTCLQCSGEKKKLEQRLHQLSHMAEQMAPVPIRSIRLPETGDRSYFQRRWWWKPVLGTAAAMVLVIILVWPQARFYIQTKIQKDVTTQETQIDNELIAQVDVLVKDPLPMKYQDILEADKADETEFDQDFMQYIIPPIKDNVSGSLPYSRKGVLS
jgi:hypothetical protein